MSYDLQAFLLPPGGDPEEALEALETDLDRPPTGEERDRMTRLAKALQATVASLEAGYPEDAIELSEDRFQVSVYANEAMISIPYWFDGAEAREVLAVALECARAIRETAGFVVWDPQLDRLLDERATVDELAEAYRSGREYVRGLDE